MKKKIFGWVITVLMLAATHAAFAYAFYSGLMWWWGAVDYDSSATDIFVALTVAILAAFVAICAVIAVKRAGAAATVWFSFMAAVSVLYKYFFPLRGTPIYSVISALDKLASYPLCSDTFMCFFAPPLLVYGALAVTSALVSRRDRRRCKAASMAAAVVSPSSSD